jgi:hypothetical protein
MGWRVWGRDYQPSQLTQRLSLPIDTSLIGARVWVILFNSPVFNSVELQILSGNAVIAESTNTYTKTQISTFTHAAREIYFDFNNVNLKKNFEYGFRINLNGYLFVPGRMFSWMIDFPRPAYDPTFVPSLVKLSSAPLTLTLIGSDE